MGIIYKATNIKNNKVYIGQTIHTLEKRKRNHYASTSGCTYFSHALHYYDEKDWVWEIIDEAKTREELNEKERYWIKFIIILKKQENKIDFMKETLVR